MIFFHKKNIYLLHLDKYLCIKRHVVRLEIELEFLFLLNFCYSRMNLTKYLGDEYKQMVDEIL
jgi:hypothetical protein